MELSEIADLERQSKESNRGGASIDREKPSIQRLMNEIKQYSRSAFR